MKVNLKQACAAKVLVDKENEGLLHELKHSVVEVDKLRCLAEEHRVSKSSRSSDADSSMRGTPPLSSPSPIKVCGILFSLCNYSFHLGSSKMALDAHKVWMRMLKDETSNYLRKNIVSY
jgi:hypothetical protein